MKAAVQHSAGAPPVIEEHDEPVAQDGEVLIQMRTAALGGQDVVGAYQHGMIYPSIVRAEGVGIDPDGRRVYFGERSRLPFGAMAERTVVPEAEVWEVPDDISDRLAITMGISGTGAYVPLRDAAHIKEGDSVLVLGATGAVGQLGLQFAKHFGAGRVVAAARNRAALDELVERGIADAGAVLQPLEQATEHAAAHRAKMDNPYEGGIEDSASAFQAGADVEALLEQAGGDGYDVVLDILYGPYFTIAAKATRPGARIVTIGAPAGPITPVASFDVAYRTHTAWGTGQAPPADRHRTWLELLELGRQGIDVNYKEFTFDELPQAHEAQRSGPRAKVLVSFP